MPLIGVELRRRIPPKSRRALNKLKAARTRDHPRLRTKRSYLCRRGASAKILSVSSTSDHTSSGAWSRSHQFRLYVNVYFGRLVPILTWTEG